MLAPDRRFFIVTGGPGAGKTTLLETLSRRGVPCMAESGRAIIRDQVAIGGPALPWADAHAFAELMLALDMRTYRHAEATTSGPVLFDRGILDVVGYRRLTGLPVPSHCDRVGRTLRYHRTIFVAPPWEAIFARDAERKQTFDDAEATFRTLMNVYEDYGYEAVSLPFASVEARADLVMETIGRCT